MQYASSLVQLIPQSHDICSVVVYTFIMQIFKVVGPKTKTLHDGRHIAGVGSEAFL